MPLSSNGLSMRQMADEFCVSSPVSMSQFYLGDTAASLVLPNGGSNLGVPRTGPISFGNMHGASCAKVTNTVSLTFQADFDALSSDPALLADFKTDVSSSLAAAAGVPVSAVTVVSVTSGSVKVAVDVRYPTDGRINVTATEKLAAIAAAVTPSTVFGAAFASKYSIGGRLTVVDMTPPGLVVATRSFPGVAGSVATLAVADMFSVTSNARPLTFSLVGTTSPAPSSVTLDRTDGTLSVAGKYRNRTYTVSAVATTSNGVTSSSPAVINVTELDAPMPYRTSNSLGAAAPSNSTSMTVYGMSNYFATVADTLPMYHYIVDNPKGNASLLNGRDLVLSGAYRNTSYTVSVATSNAYGKVAASNIALACTEPQAPVPVASNVLGSRTVTGNETVAYNLGHYFTTQADTMPLYYYLTGNSPYNNAYITPPNLFVTGNNRGVSYNVNVGASNAYGRSNSQVLSVTETPAIPFPPVTTNMVGYYTGDTWNGTQTWTDVSGSSNHATLTGTVRADTYQFTTRRFLYGGTAATVSFPAAILPATYTLFHVARYNGTAKQRIFTSTSAGNWLSGFWTGKTGIAFRGNQFITATTNDVAPNNAWFQSTDQNNLYRANKFDYTTSTINTSTTSTPPLTVNMWTGEESDWGIAMVLVYNRHLTFAEYTSVENWITSIYTGV